MATKLAAEEFLNKELGFRKEEITDMKIEEVNRPRKEDSNTVYITVKDAITSQIFRTSATICNNDIRVSNFVATQFFARYSALQLYTKQAREQDTEL